MFVPEHMFSVRHRPVVERRTGLATILGSEIRPESSISLIDDFESSIMESFAGRKNSEQGTNFLTEVVRTITDVWL